MSKFIIKKVGKDRVNVSKQENCRMFNVSWRIGTSRTVDNNRNDIAEAKLYIDKYIENRKGWSLTQLVDAYPGQYRKALDRKTGDKAALTYKQAIKELIPYLRQRKSTNTLYSKINILKHMGETYNLNDLDVKAISANEVIRLLYKKHESLNPTSLATFDAYLAAFRSLFDFLEHEGYIEKDLLSELKPKRPLVKNTKVNSRKYYEKFELDYIYECLDDNRHIIVNDEGFYERRRELYKDKIDPQFYKAHYKVRRILQVMMDTGMRQGEVISLRREAVNGMVSLDRDIVFNSKVWKNLEVAYDELIFEDPYVSLLEFSKKEKLHVGNLPTVYPDSVRLTYSDKVRILNTVKFLQHFEDDDLTKWSDFGWRNPMHGDHRISKRNRKTVGISKIVSYDTDIFFLADAVPNYEASVYVASTVTKDIDSEGKMFVTSKLGAKTDAGSYRIVPLSKRARLTFVKLWRDILILEQPDTEKIDYLFLNPDGKLYDPTSISNAWSKLIKKMTKYNPDLPVLTPHNLRHSYLTLKARKAKDMGDLLEIRDEAGHESLSTTMNVYVGRKKGFVDKNNSEV